MNYIHSFPNAAAQTSTGPIFSFPHPPRTQTHLLSVRRKFPQTWNRDERSLQQLILPPSALKTKVIESETVPLKRWTRLRDPFLVTVSLPTRPSPPGSDHQHDAQNLAKGRNVFSLHFHLMRNLEAHRSTSEILSCSFRYELE